jgi:hypothetical protein
VLCIHVHVWEDQVSSRQDSLLYLTPDPPHQPSTHPLPWYYHSPHSSRIAYLPSFPLFLPFFVSPFYWPGFFPKHVNNSSLCLLIATTSKLLYLIIPPCFSINCHGPVSI